MLRGKGGGGGGTVKQLNTTKKLCVYVYLCRFLPKSDLPSLNRSSAHVE